MNKSIARPLRVGQRLDILEASHLFINTIRALCPRRRRGPFLSSRSSTLFPPLGRPNLDDVFSEHNMSATAGTPRKKSPPMNSSAAVGKLRPAAEITCRPVPRNHGGKSRITYPAQVRHFQVVPTPQKSRHIKIPPTYNLYPLHDLEKIIDLNDLSFLSRSKCSVLEARLRSRRNRTGNKPRATDSGFPPSSSGAPRSEKPGDEPGSGEAFPQFVSTTV